MSISWTIFVLPWILFTFHAAGLTVDGVALIAFRNSLIGDPYNSFGDWNESQDTPCSWSGVSCANVPLNLVPRVVGLSIIGKRLSGSMSSALGALDQLRRLSLQGNSLNGTLPAGLFNATSLHTILLGGNRITGSLPPEIRRLRSLQTLDISSNLFLGQIPAAITNCRQLQTLVLANNFFSGPIPNGIGLNLTNLEQLDLSANLLSGAIPNDLGRLSSLRGTLNLSFNHLTGPIPYSLGNLPYTVSLDLSHNNLSGRIPQDGSLAEQGPGPFLNNPGLCGFPLNTACSMSPYVSPLPSLPTEGSSSLNGPSRNGKQNSAIGKKPNLSTGAIVAITVGDAIGISTLAVLFIYLYWRAKIGRDKSGSGVNKEKRHGSRRCFRASSEDSEASGSSEKAKEQGELVPLDKGFAFDIDELLRASAYVLGKSGLGIVYKVVLGNGSPVAVRRLGEGGTQRQKEFETEVHAIGRVRHPNVVRLCAYYWADDEKLLIYDYISNGSLATALHGPVQSPSGPLSWAARLKIAGGVARGLAYLHECSPRRYVHGDFKTTKVLLDAAMESYIADFGLARLISIAGTGMQDATPVAGGALAASSSSAVAASSATPAAAAGSDWALRMKSTSSFYRAPEAMTDVKPAQKWDVYSFGVVLLELLSGRSPAVQMASAGVDLVAWMRRGVEDGRPNAQILDPALCTSEDDASVTALLNLAMACTSVTPDQRPKMKYVAESIEKLAVPSRP